MRPLTPLFDLLGFNTLNETFFPPSSLFIWIASNLYRRRRRHLSSPRQIQGKNDFGGTRTRKDPGGGGGRLANTRRRLGVQRGEAKKRERKTERDCFI